MAKNAIILFILMREKKMRILDTAHLAIDCHDLYSLLSRILPSVWNT